MSKYKFNVIIYGKEDTVSNYNRMYSNYPTEQQIKGCLRKFYKKRKTNRYNGYDIFITNKEQKL